MRASLGFTILELVAFILIVSILSAGMAVAYSEVNKRSAGDQADQLRRDIAHLQLLATTWRVVLRLSTNSGGTAYTVTCITATTGTGCAAVDDTATDPATNAAFTVTLTDNVTISPVSATLDFDSLGRPVSSGSLVSTNPVCVDGTTTCTSTYTLTGSSTSATVTVRPITGLAQSS
jgi:Tfp pilus assembly protein PilE